jgi:CHAT domain-containing protein
VTRFARVAAPGRGTLARLSIAVPYARCAPETRSPVAADTASRIARTVCPGARARATAADRLASGRLLRQAAAERDARVSADALHALALADLAQPDAPDAAIARAVVGLHAAARVAGSPASVLTDLSAAYLTRAELRQEPRDLYQAIESAAEAVERAPGDAPARFNLALALEGAHLSEQAALAWRDYLRRDAASPWAAEARARLAALAPPSPPDVERWARTRDAAGALALAERAPQEARLYGWEVALPEWGDAVLRNDAAAAARALDAAARLGAALTLRGRDRSLDDAVRTVRAAAPRRLRALAAAHRRYGEAQALYRDTRYGESAALLTRAEEEATAAGADALRVWCTVFHPMALGNAGAPDAAERGLHAALAALDAARHPAAAGRAAWMLGTTRYRLGRSEDALRALRAADAHLARAGEREHLGFVRGLQMQAYGALGRRAETYRALHDALRLLRDYRASYWTHGILYVAALAVAQDGLPRAAEYVQAEGVGVAGRTGRAIDLAEARLAYVRLRAARGVPDAARGLEGADALVGDIPSGRMRRWLAADLRLSQAMTTLRGQGGAELAALDSVVHFFGDPPFPGRLIPALVTRAERRLTRGDTSGAARDLEEASERLARQGGATGSIPLRASLLRSARHVTDRVVMLHVGRGRPIDALRALERGRVALGAARDTGATALVAPPGVAVLDLAVVGDTLLAWAIAGREVTFTRLPVDASRLARTADTARAALELGLSASAAVPALERLYDLLLRPLGWALGPDSGPLVLITDGELAGVPFAALRDARRGRYLVEMREVRHALDLHSALASVAGGADAAARGQATPVRSSPEVVLVGDPAFDAAAFPALGRLDGAGAEVEELGALYPSATRLADRGATGQAVRRVIRRARVLHWAGHAVVDDEEPDRSQLVLAPDSGRDGFAALAASEIAALDLRALRLAVLSACETARERSGHASGVDGLAGAFLAGGAQGVVASLWRVSDARTRPFMLRFHRAYRAHGDAGRALREAQLALLRAPDPALRAPATWAAFRYLGR